MASWNKFCFVAQCTMHVQMGTDSVNGYKQKRNISLYDRLKNGQHSKSKFIENIYDYNEIDLAKQTKKKLALLWILFELKYFN